MGIKNQKSLDSLKKRLYERGQQDIKPKNFELEDNSKTVTSQWKTPPQPLQKPVAKQPVYSDDSESHISSSELTMKKKKTYRAKLVMLGLAVLVFSIGVASVLTLSGNNTISGKNIAIAITGPLTVGGGEVIPLQVGITNNNTVAINSATLIVEYPSGTQSVADNAGDLHIERLQLDTIKGGETLNIPLRAIVYGEENEEKEVKVSIEYRVEGSNAVFFKEAESLFFKISSSPISLKVDNEVRISSGQETEMSFTITSNSPTNLSGLLVKAEYPRGFDFSKAEPAPDYAQNMWLIKNLKPESSKTFTIKGVIDGNEGENTAINILVGVPSESKPQELTSVFVSDKANFQIERPFFDIDMKIDGQSSNDVSVEPGSNFGVTIEALNMLDYTLYDTSVKVFLSGNAVAGADINVDNGFYNSANNTITWEVGSQSSLEQTLPGNKAKVSFSVKPDTKVTKTPQINIDVQVQSKRVSADRVAEKLESTDSAVVRVVSTPKIAADVIYNKGAFIDVGPIPPRAEEETTYTLSYMLTSGSNSITNSTVTANLPSYVKWLDQTSGSGEVEFNPINRTLTWNPGNVAANASVFVSFQVGLTPSKSQIGNTLTLLDKQTLKATDLFTNQVVRDEHTALTTELSRETGYPSGNGRVTE